MSESGTSSEQTHPLYSSDRAIVDRLLAKEKPDSSDLVDLARLFIRYEDFQGAFDIKSDLLKTLKAWELNRESLDIKTRAIWASGFRPGDQIIDSVGSGFDTSNSDGI